MKMAEVMPSTKATANSGTAEAFSTSRHARFSWPVCSAPTPRSQDALPIRATALMNAKINQEVCHETPASAMTSAAPPAVYRIIERRPD